MGCLDKPHWLCQMRPTLGLNQIFSITTWLSRIAEVVKQKLLTSIFFAPKTLL